MSDNVIRAELFSTERLEQHAQSLAAEQRIAKKPARGRKLSRRLAENGHVLTETYLAILRAAAANQPTTPAANWLLDNFHIVQEQLREIKDDLPPGFYRRLPKLADGPLQGYPRVFGVAWALVAHTDSAVDLPKLQCFVEAYQRVQPLTIGELWALAITLRITLVENLRRLAETIAAQQTAGLLADQLADLALGTENIAGLAEADTLLLFRPGRCFAGLVGHDVGEILCVGFKIVHPVRLAHRDVQDAVRYEGREKCRDFAFLGSPFLHQRLHPAVLGDLLLVIDIHGDQGVGQWLEPAGVKVDDPRTAVGQDLNELVGA